MAAPRVRASRGFSTPWSATRDALGAVRRHAAALLIRHPQDAGASPPTGAAAPGAGARNDDRPLGGAGSSLGRLRPVRTPARSCCSGTSVPKVLAILDAPDVDWIFQQTGRSRPSYSAASLWLLHDHGQPLRGRRPLAAAAQRRRPDVTATAMVLDRVGGVGGGDRGGPPADAQDTEGLNGARSWWWRSARQDGDVPPAAVAPLRDWLEALGEDAHALTSPRSLRGAVRELAETTERARGGRPQPEHAESLPPRGDRRSRRAAGSRRLHARRAPCCAGRCSRAGAASSAWEVFRGLEADRTGADVRAFSRSPAPEVRVEEAMERACRRWWSTRHAPPSSGAALAAGRPGRCCSRGATWRRCHPSSAGGRQSVRTGGRT
ncbi:hypothetical protein QJS66_00715 [Kocuria rhizophila]|nr:hypothetical protein QJS66_00715 [Kocuria rhizophila]